MCERVEVHKLIHRENIGNCSRWVCEKCGHEIILDPVNAHRRLVNAGDPCAKHIARVVFIRDGDKMQLIPLTNLRNLTNMIMESLAEQQQGHAAND